MNSLSLGILTALRDRGEIQGTEELARILNTSHKEYALREARVLASIGLIELIQSSGGRGRKNIFRNIGVFKMDQQKRDPA